MKNSLFTAGSIQPVHGDVNTPGVYLMGISSEGFGQTVKVVVK